MSTLEKLQELLPELPRVTAILHRDLTLTNSLTGRKAIIHKGRRTFVVVKRGDIRWIYWLSGIRQGRLVGMSDSYFAVQFEDPGLARISSYPTLAKVA